MVKIKRVYEPRDPSDGERILVDRLWPRGISKSAAAVDEWMKDIAPSDALRKWFGHDPERWPGFRRRYLAELGRRHDELASLAAKARRGRITLVFGARDTERNNAVVLKGALERLAGRPSGARRRIA